MPSALSLVTKLSCATAFHLAFISSAPCGTPLESGFTHPPDSARPWVWGHWLHGNVDQKCITRELTAMKRAGLGGMTMFDVAQPGIPAGPHTYMSPTWQELFAWQITEAKRLGLEVMSHVGPGYCGTGGPWITPELAAQRIFETSTRVKGGKRFSGNLPQPATEGGFYQDVAVLAIRESAAQSKPKIDDLDMKRLVWLNYIRWRGTRSAPHDAEIAKADCIPPTDILDLTKMMRPGGSLDWDAPAGDWTILRFGHGWSGQKTLPATPEGNGPECDKLDKRGVRAHFDHIMKRMVQLAGPAAGKTFHTFFMDSWEAGGQNWTAAMPAEFKRRRGYDIIPFLPVLTGRVIGDLATSERFLYDLRQTASELAAENFWAELRRLCNANGMRLAIQPYITAGNDLDAANFTDEPMGEFWAIQNVPGHDYNISVKLASSAANLNGQLIVGAEAFTSTAAERWLSHPAKLKELGDQMFAMGANRFQFHRFAMQRFPNIKPGMMMGGWGQQYDSTQTWWEWSKPWHDYLARCQYLLRQGPIVTDVLALVSEEPLQRFEHKPVAGYNYDACGPDTFKRITMEGGRPAIPGGPAYQLITVNHHGTMTVARLRKLRDLVKDGAALLGEPPLATPGLENLPAADDELKTIATELWGDAGESERQIGKGRVFRGITPQDALTRLGASPDFSEPGNSSNLSWIHRRAGDVDIYFVATTSDEASTPACTFRVRGKRAELWNPETGKIRPLETFPADRQRSTVHVPLDVDGSAFIVFRPDTGADPSAPAINRIGNSPATATADAPPPRELNGAWTLTFPKDSGVASSLRLEPLVSWSVHPDPNVRHFSGTATYSKQFEIPELKSNIILDLGRVEVMARVKLNGKDLGILWKAPYRIDITDAAVPGTNQLEISVVNLWVNRLIGDQSLPDDAKRHENGTLKEWPAWLLDGKPSPSGRRSFVTFPLWKKNEPLRESGLLGPVVLRFAEH